MTNRQGAATLRLRGFTNIHAIENWETFTATKGGVALDIPIHYNDYTVFKSPLTDFQDRVVAAGLADRVRYLSHGDTYTFEVPASRR